jgi:23S rRNA pseudouridine1911/1915/1917 synthase
VDAPIDRHPVDRVRMAVRTGGRDAVTHYRVIERFRRHTWVRVLLETGRTHQIRLHLAHAGYPLVGDQVYGRRLEIPRGATAGLEAALRDFRRQALHAAKLTFPHPTDGRAVEVTAPLPADFLALITALRRDRAAAER